MSDIDLSDNSVVNLSDDQKDKIVAAFADGNIPDLSSLTQDIFGDSSLDGRSRQGRAIKKYISEFNIGKVKSTTPKPSTGNVELNRQQLQQLDQERVQAGFSMLGFARRIHNNPELCAASREVRAVKEYISQLDDIDDRKKLRVDDSGEFISTSYIPAQYSKPEQATEKYRPPMTTAQTIARINKYLNYNWKEESLKKIELKRVNALMSYLRIFRFQYQINSYSRIEDRELFEDAFIRYAHDKEDLTQEELDQFITLANEGVIAADIQRRLEYLRMSLDDMASDSEGKKISMGLNEAINNAQTEYNQCISRQEKLYKSLTVNRAKRVELMQSENASILNLVQAWKQEDYRIRMISLAEKQKESLAEEVEKMTSIEEWKAIIKGLDPREVLN